MERMESGYRGSRTKKGGRWKGEIEREKNDDEKATRLTLLEHSAIQDRRKTVAVMSQ
jgi:hypothetical protein